MPQVLTFLEQAPRAQLEKYSACESCVFWILGIGCCRSNSPYFRSNMPVPVCGQYRALPERQMAGGGLCFA